MPERINRNVILNLNKFQKKILYPILLVSLLACISALLCLAYAFYPENHKIFFDLNLATLRPHLPIYFCAFSMILLFSMFWAYWISNKLLGPYERVIGELDDVLSGQSKDPIGTRKGDEMYEGLLSRINQLIK